MLAILRRLQVRHPSAMVATITVEGGEESGSGDSDPAEEFCEQYMATCSNYNSFMGADMDAMTATCMMSFGGTPVGEATDTSGYTQGCRSYHLGAALSDAGLHCPHA